MLIAAGDGSSTSGLHFYNTTASNWTIALTDVRYNNATYFLANETTKAYFNYQVD